MNTDTNCDFIKVSLFSWEPDCTHTLLQSMSDTESYQLPFLLI